MKERMKVEYYLQFILNQRIQSLLYSKSADSFYLYSTFMLVNLHKNVELIWLCIGKIIPLCPKWHFINATLIAFTTQSQAR